MPSLGLVRTGALVGLLLWVAFPAWGDPSRKQILILQSYNERYAWTRSIGEGLAQGLGESSWDLWYEYLDAKNLDLNFDFSVFDQVLQRKYADRRFDLVVTVDDPAYQYFVRTRQSIFRGAAAVSLGMNAPPDRREPGVSYLIEVPDYARTLNLALAQYPEARTIHVVVDRSVTGRAIRRNIESLALDRPMMWDWIDSGGPEDIGTRTARIGEDGILVFAVYFDPAAGYVSNDRILSRIRETARVPIYGFWDFSLRSGAMGGFLYDGGMLGTEGAAMVKRRVVDGQEPEYSAGTLSRWVFDWRQVEAHGLPEASFPPGSEFLFRPEAFWRISPTAVVVFLAGFIVLAAFTGLVLFNLRNQKALVAFGDTMIATQRELMHNLGNVIENRSEETASHVQRITVLGLLLADKVGITADERIQLEVCAPMHDIGKVGIPDSILKKAGTLTAEERLVMQDHTRIGHSIFKSSPNPLIRAAARIALEHHERWDGAGYPDGKAGESIDKLARIVAVVDVFDALLTERVYKEAWPKERVQEFFIREQGKMFDPRLVDILLDNFDEFHHLWTVSV